MRVLLTGSSGWLGRFLASALHVAGHEVIGIDVAAGNHTQIVGSVSDYELIKRTFSNFCFDAVIHAGALHKPDIVRQSAQAFIDVNVTGTLNLLTCSIDHNIDRFVFTSTTSLMISQAIRAERGTAAIWLDEQSGPLEPRNIYGVTKLAAEGLCRDAHVRHGLPCVVLRTSRFFPEDDDTHSVPSGENLKANELLYRRATVEDMARAHILALEKAPQIGFDVLIVSAPPPFVREDVIDLKFDAASVIQKYFPDAAAVYESRGWTLPTTIGRVYDPARAEQVLGFRADTDFGTLLEALKHGHELPFAHDPDYLPPHADLNLTMSG